MNTNCVSLETLEPRRLFSLAASLVEIPISAAAKIADPALQNYRSFDLRVTLQAGDKWTFADIFASLTRGKFYTPPTMDQSYPQPPEWSAHPNLRYDTFVCDPDFASAPLAGEYIGTAVGHRWPDAQFTSTRLNATWMNANGGQFGPATSTEHLTIGRITVSSDAVGSIAGRIGGASPHASGTVGFFFPGMPGSTTVAGTFFNDPHRDGHPSPIDVHGLPGWRVYLDSNDNGVLDAGETSTVTDEVGHFVFTGLAPGTYTLRFIHQSGWRTTTPWAQSVTVSAGQQIGWMAFGEQRVG